MKEFFFAIACGTIASFPFGIALIVSNLMGWEFVKREYSFLVPLVMIIAIICCYYSQKSEKKFSTEETGA